MERQVKLFQVFNRSVIDNLIRTFGQEKIVRFTDSNIVGINYDYSSNKLSKIMDQIPYGEVQQYIITSSSLLDLIRKASVQGLRPAIYLDVDLGDEEEQETLDNAVSELKRSPSEMNFNILKEEISRLEEQYHVFLTAISFYVNNERVRIQSNGILLASDSTLNVADEMLSCH